MFPAIPWRVGPPRDPAAVPGEMVEQVAHLADVDDVECEVVEVRVARVDERHHVVLGVDVEPDARLAEPVGDLHPEHLRVERAFALRSPVRQLTCPSRRGRRGARRRGPRVLRPAVDLARRRAVRQQLDRPAVGIASQSDAVALLVRDAERVEVRRASSSEQARWSSKAMWSCPGSPA